MVKNTIECLKQDNLKLRIGRKIIDFSAENLTNESAFSGYETETAQGAERKRSAEYYMKKET